MWWDGVRPRGRSAELWPRRGDVSGTGLGPPRPCSPAARGDLCTGQNLQAFGAAELRAAVLDVAST